MIQPINISDACMVLPCLVYVLCNWMCFLPWMYTLALFMYCVTGCSFHHRYIATHCADFKHFSTLFRSNYKVSLLIVSVNKVDGRVSEPSTAKQFCCSESSSLGFVGLSCRAVCIFTFYCHPARAAVVYTWSACGCLSTHTLARQVTSGCLMS